MPLLTPLTTLTPLATLTPLSPQGKPGSRPPGGAVPGVRRQAHPRRAASPMPWDIRGVKQIEMASSVYSFDIETTETPNQIYDAWKVHYAEYESQRSIIGYNCADAAQWALTQFAGIPKPNLSNISLNYVTLGIWWLSCIPCPVTLPGRIMSNAQYIASARHPEQAYAYSRVLLAVAMALSLSIISASLFGFDLAATLLSDALNTFGERSTASMLVGVCSAFGFFSMYKKWSTQSMVEKDNRFISQTLK